MCRAASEVAGREIVRAQPEVVLEAPVDPVLLEQVLLNLLENAGKYTPGGSPIEVRIEARNGQAVIEVADRGPGLPPGEERRVFERFYRVADSHRSHGALHGTGLGLTICEAIVRAHQGRITAENRAGGGALFRLTLPLGRPYTAWAASPHSIQPPTSRGHEHGREDQGAARAAPRAL